MVEMKVHGYTTVFGDRYFLEFPVEEAPDQVVTLETGLLCLDKDFTPVNKSDF